MLRSTRLNMKNSTLKGKYSFQYIEDSVFENCNFDTKDAFWHAKNITVCNSIVKGEYLAWYSENITFENCTMIDCDLSFERSEVEADIIGDIVSVKNVYSGYVRAESIGEIITDYENAKCKIMINETVCG